MFTQLPLGSEIPVAFSYDWQSPERPGEGSFLLPHLIQSGHTIWVQWKIWNTSAVPTSLNLTVFGCDNQHGGMGIDCWRIKPDGITPDSQLYKAAWIPKESGESVYLKIAGFTGVLISVLVTGTPEGDSQIGFSDLYTNQGPQEDGTQVVNCRIIYPQELRRACTPGVSPVVPGTPGTSTAGGGHPTSLSGHTSPFSPPF